MSHHAILPKPQSILLCAWVLATIGATTVATVARAVPRDGPVVPSNGSVESQPGPAKASTRRLVFSCIAPGLITFADRPCGPASEARELLLRVDAKPNATLGQSGRTATVAPEVSRASTRERDAEREPLAGAERASSTAATCQRLQDAISTLDARMRNGYSAAEAGRLWDRWRDAKARLREMDC